MAPESVPDPIRVAVEFAAVLERTGVAYVAAGSLASSVHGAPRSTDDIDIVFDLRLPRVPLGPPRFGTRSALYPDTGAFKGPSCHRPHVILCNRASGEVCAAGLIHRGGV